MVVLALLFRQCNKTSLETAKLAQTTLIADANFKAIKDSTIQLQLTREQLKSYDVKLSNVVKFSDSLVKVLGTKNKTLNVLSIQPIVNNSVTVVKNQSRDFDPVVIPSLINDTNKIDKKYKFDWVVNDSIKSFSGTTSVYLVKNNDTLNIMSDSTKIKNFKLNFDMVIIKYDDGIQKVTKYKIVPYFTDTNGQMHELSDNQIKFNYRGIELLDKPWNPNVVTSLQPQKKLRFTGLWGIGMNPIGVSLITKNNILSLSYGPSISVGYFLTLQKR